MVSVVFGWELMAVDDEYVVAAVEGIIPCEISPSSLSISLLLGFSLTTNLQCSLSLMFF